MKNDPPAATRPDPNCPDCHGTGVVTIFSPLLDRVDEVDAACGRCSRRDTREDADVESE